MGASFAVQVGVRVRRANQNPVKGNSALPTGGSTGKRIEASQEQTPGEGTRTPLRSHGALAGHVRPQGSAKRDGQV